MALKGFEKALSLNSAIKKINKKEKPKKLSKMSTVVDRLKVATDYIVSKMSHYTEYKCLYTKKEVEEYLYTLPENAEVAIDTETTGLNVFNDKVVGICLSTDGKPSVYIPVFHLDPVTRELLQKQVKKEEITEIFTNLTNKRSDIRLIYHNAEFDNRILLHSFDLPIEFTKLCFWDTMTISHCIDENERHALKVLHLKYCPKEHEEEPIEFSDLFGDVEFSLIDPEVAKLYAAGDADKTLDLYKWQVNFLNKEGNEKLKNYIYTIEAPVISAIIRMEERGCLINLKRLEELDEKYKKLIEETSSTCYKELEPYKNKIDNYRKTHPKKDKIDDPINLQASKQISILLYSILGFKPPKVAEIEDDESKYKKKQDPTDEDSLKILIEKYPNFKVFLENLLENRHAVKMKSTYIDAIREKVHPDGRLRGVFSPNGTVTGRFASSEPNLQNIPANSEFRSMFYGGDDYYIANADYSKQEVFLTTEECQDPKLIAVFHENKDIYGVLASEIYHKAYEDCLEFYINPDGSKKKDEHGVEIENVIGHKRRSMGKGGWLGITYGLGAAGLAERANRDLEEGEDPITVDDAKFILKELKAGFKVAFEWIDWTHEFVHKYGYVENMYGRRRHLPDIKLPKYTVEFEKDDDGNIITPTYYEEDPLDFTPTDKKEFKIEDIPKSVYLPYFARLDKAFGKKQVDAIKEEFKKKEKLFIKINSDKIARAERQSVNSKIQGDASCLIKNVMVNVDKDEILKKLGVSLISTIHDEIMLELKKEHAQEGVKRIREIMVNTAQEYVKSVKVKVDMVLGPYWYCDKDNKAIPIED